MKRLLAPATRKMLNVLRKVGAARRNAAIAQSAKLAQRGDLRLLSKHRPKQCPATDYELILRAFW
jgi:hypothetical protein